MPVCPHVPCARALRTQVIERLLAQGNRQAQTDPGTVVLSHLRLSSRAQTMTSDWDRACPPDPARCLARLGSCCARSRSS